MIARETSDEMLRRLDLMTLKPRLILDIGSGPGESAAQLGERYPHATIIAIDRSLPMIQHAMQLSSLTTGLCALGEKLPVQNQKVDLIFANFFLPWQPEMNIILQEWLRVLAPNGLLMLSALGLNTLQEWRGRLKTQHIPLFVDMHDIGDALIQTGFDDPVLDVDHCQLIYRDRCRFVDELKDSHFWFPDNQIDLASAHLFEETDGGIWPVTYEIIFAHAFAPHQSNEFSPTDDGSIKIPLAHLRRTLTG